MPRTLPASPDDASDLWGRKPHRPCLCPGCGLTAEPFVEGGSFCFVCISSGRAARLMGLQRVRPQNQSGAKPQPERAAAPQ